MTHLFFATCPRGLEAILADELQALGASVGGSTEGGVHFTGDWAICAKANIHSRIASRVLWRVADGRYRTEDDIYQIARKTAWLDLFSVNCSIKVSTVAQRCPLRSLEFITLKIKDAICDVFNAHKGSRPSVDKSTPDMRIHAFLTESRCTIYLDTSGEALFKRGWRVQTGEAPLRENLAAGILRLTGWQPNQALLDPMCGSGTFLIEAAHMALNIAPGARRPLALEQIIACPANIIQAEREAAIAAEHPPRPLPIKGNDMDADVLECALANLHMAKLKDCVTLSCGDLQDCEPQANQGVIVSNPPYGVRIGELAYLDELYPQIGHWLKKRCTGWNAYFLTGDPQLAKRIRLSTSRRTPLFNGALECRLFEYKMVAGSARKPKEL